mmetsp:Transcript_13827/g.31052  ORF Transcript_13827/g.31052 Transcript_13827/m.31052 type:complete len:246 (+) Transcript_13827:187-924(+)
MVCPFKESILGTAYQCPHVAAMCHQLPHPRRIIMQHHLHGNRALYLVPRQQLRRHGLWQLLAECPMWHQLRSRGHLQCSQRLWHRILHIKVILPMPRTGFRPMSLRGFRPMFLRGLCSLSLTGLPRMSLKLLQQLHLKAIRPIFLQPRSRGISRTEREEREVSLTNRCRRGQMILRALPRPWCRRLSARRGAAVREQCDEFLWCLIPIGPCSSYGCLVPDCAEARTLVGLMSRAHATLGMLHQST